MNSDFFTLRQASIEETTEIDSRTFAEWGLKLSLVDYRLREQRLRTHPWAKPRQTLWLGQAAGRAVFSCETYRLDFKEGESSGGQSLFCVASVYVPPEDRGRGYGVRGMHALWELLQRTEPRFAGVLLFSDVDPAFYRRLGYHSLSDFEWRMPSARYVSGSQTLSFDDPWIDAALEGHGFFLRAQREHADWHWTRARFYHEKGCIPALDLAGYRSGDSFALATVDSKGQSLRVLISKYENAGEAKEIIQSLSTYAHQKQLESVIGWEFSEQARFLGDFRSQMKDSLPMIRLAHSTHDQLDSLSSIQCPRIFWA